MKLRSVSSCLLLFLLACAGGSETPKPFPVDQLGDIAYSGTESGEVRLVAGVWQGDPYEPGAESRPEVDLAQTEPLLGDLDGDGSEEAVVVLTEQTGGSGIFVYLAVVGQSDAGLENLATSLLGDRVAISSMRIEDGSLIVNIVTAGPDDPMCCPTLRQEVSWRLESSELREISREDRGRIETDH
jgi:hypothetical protein